MKKSELIGLIKEAYQEVIKEQEETKPEAKFKKGDKVKYLPKLSGLSPSKVFVVNHVRWQDSDDLSKMFGIDWKPTYVYSFVGISLGAVEDDLKKV